MKQSDLVELHTLFQIRHGNKFDLNKMSQCSQADGCIAFVGRAGVRGGIAAFVQPYKNIEPFDAGFITVALGGSALSSFVQPRPFYTAQNIDVLVPRHEMSLDVKMYYCVCVEANRFRYSTFGREANRTLNKLLVPRLEDVPRWVPGIATKAAASLVEDIRAAV